MSRHIAIVEDEAAIAANYRDALQHRGHKVSIYADRAAASAAFAAQLPDLAIIDIGLGEDVDGGFELCRELRARCPRTPIVFLTARDAEIDHVVGMRLGANDYLSKDVSLEIMLVHIAALFRQADAMAGPLKDEDLITVGDLQLNSERMTARWKSQEVDLTASTEFPMVMALVRRPGQVKSRQQLMDAAGKLVEETSITSHIKRIRRKFQKLDTTFDAIETVYGAGYRWTG